MAVLRVLGLTGPQVRATVAWQATALAVVGLLFGIPLGLALGRTLWRVVAERTPVQYVPRLALLAVLVVVPLSLLIVNVLAAYPGRRAARQRISTVLGRSDDARRTAVRRIVQPCVTSTSWNSSLPPATSCSEMMPRPRA